MKASFHNHYNINPVKSECMESDSIISEYIRLAQKAGAADVGFADLTSVEDPDPDFEARRRGYSTAVSIVVPLSKGVLAEVRTMPTITYFAHYRAVNRRIDDITLQISLAFEKNGYDAFPVPASQSDPDDEYAGIFPHKTAAVLSGMGWIGKNALFIHHHYGPLVRLGTVLTTMKVEKKPLMPDRCGSCTICRNICPAMAIEGNHCIPGMERKALIDVRACSMHMKNAYQHIGRGSVCGLCMTHCPYSGLGVINEE